MKVSVKARDQKRSAAYNYAATLSFGAPSSPEKTSPCRSLDARATHPDTDAKGKIVAGIINDELAARLQTKCNQSADSSNRAQDSQTTLSTFGGGSIYSSCIFVKYCFLMFLPSGSNTSANKLNSILGIKRASLAAVAQIESSVRGSGDVACEAGS